MSATVLIVFSDPAMAERLGQLVLAGTPEAAVGTIGSPEDAIAALDQYDDIALCICEVYFEGSDGLAFLSAIRARFRRARLIIVSSYNLQNFGDHIQGLTVFRTPLDEAIFTATCQDALVTLEGHEFPPFRLGPKQPPDRWGDCYAAYDTGVKRDIFITVCHSWASQEEIERFRSFAALMARAVHPNVQAVYQAGTYQGRDFFSREKWDMLNLAEMATAGQIIDPRLAVQIIHIIGSVVIFWDSNKFPHTLVGATDISLSPQGVVKVANCVDPSQPLTPPGLGYLSALANAVQALLPPPDEVPVRVRKLLNELRAGPVPLARLVSEAQAIDTDLAPERQITVSKEHNIAKQAIEVERRKQKRTQYMMFLGFALVVTVVGYIVYTLIAPAKAPPTSGDEMVKIPAGPYVYQAGPDTLDHDFYIDKYEVTIGQYLRFVRAVEDTGNDNAWREPNQPASKSWTHQPVDWGAMIDAIKSHTEYQKQMLSENSPIFNIDWFDAEAYAKWAGKRLPTEKEWEKAARGTQGFIYPWGNTFAPKANTEEIPPGSQYMPVRNLATVDQFPEDVSPFGVFDMGGNVSEWTDTLVPGKNPTDMNPVIRGGNFVVRSTEHAILTYRDADWPPTERDLWLGFRCASDTPPVEQK